MGIKRKVVIDTAGCKNSVGVSANGTNERAVARTIGDWLVTRLKKNGFDCVMVNYKNKDKAEDSKLIDNMLALRGWKKKDCIFVDIHASYSASSGTSGPCVISNKGSSSGILASKTLTSYITGMKSSRNSYKYNSNKSHYDAKYSQLKGWFAAMQFHPFNIRNKKDAELFTKCQLFGSEDAQFGHIHSNATNYSLLVANAILEGIGACCKVATDNGDLQEDPLGADGGVANASNAMANSMGSVSTEGATGNVDSWIGTKFGEDYDYSTVTFSQLLQASYDEKKYGPNIAQISQPLVKFTNAGAFYDMESEDNADATEVLKQYAKFYLESNNARVDTCNLQLIGSPWLRPGFNVWLDPVYEDKIYYIDSITHSGNPSSGAYTNLTLSYGRRRNDFLATGKNKKLGSIGDDDNIFTKDKYYKKAKNFGTVLDSKSDFDSYKTKLAQIESTLSSKGIITADESPYTVIYKDGKGDDALRNPTINVVNEVGDVIFEKDEWEKITGRKDYDKLLQDQKAKTKDEDDDESDPDDDKSVTDEQKKGSKDDTKKDNTKKDDTKKDNNKSGRPFEATSSSKASASTTSTKDTTTDSGAKKVTTRLQDSDDTKMSWKSGRFVCDNSLKKGKSGNTVKQLQSILNKFIDDGTIKGDKLTVDGKFGTKTETRLKAYQKAKKLKVDGVCGTKTVAQINKDLGFSEKTSLSEGEQVETKEASGRLTDMMFTDAYSIDEIQSMLTSVYKKAPEVVTRRKNVIKKGCDALRKVMDSYYVNNDWNK